MKTENAISQRFAELIKALGLSNYAFAKSIGKSSTAVNFIVDGKTKPGFDILESTLGNYPNVNPEWLMKGIGEVFKTSEESESQSANKNEESIYLQEHLKTLEENFQRLAAQLESKDKQLENKDKQIESKDKQIDGLQRTVDSLLGNPVIKERSFHKPVSETGRVVEMFPKLEKVG